MNINELKNLLERNRDKNLTFILPNKTAIPPHFHITEVGHVQKDFIDCGGTRRSSSTCMLQAWVAENDEEHSLSAGKLVSILKLAGEILSSNNLSVEVEFEAPIISQFPIASARVTGKTVVFHLANKHTDCLAKEQCGLDDASSCCS
jgi:hypothetical protein